MMLFFLAIGLPTFYIQHIANIQTNERFRLNRLPTFYISHSQYSTIIDFVYNTGFHHSTSHSQYSTIRDLATQASNILYHIANIQSYTFNYNAGFHYSTSRSLYSTIRDSATQASNILYHIANIQPYRFQLQHGLPSSYITQPIFNHVDFDYNTGFHHPTSHSQYSTIQILTTTWASIILHQIANIQPIKIQLHGLPIAHSQYSIIKGFADVSWPNQAPLYLCPLIRNETNIERLPIIGHNFLPTP